MIYEREKSMILLPRLMHAVTVIRVHGPCKIYLDNIAFTISQKLGLDDTYNFFPYE